jgi:hypothetical protein
VGELGVDHIYLRTLATMSAPVSGLNYHLLPPYLHPEFEKHVREAKEAITESRARVITDPDSWSAPVLSRGLAELVQIEPPRVVERRDALSDRAVRERYAAYYSDMRGTGQRLAAPDLAADIFDDGSNPFSRHPPFDCYFIYHDFIVNDFNLRMIPCCYMAQVPGFEVVRFDGQPAVHGVLELTGVRNSAQAASGRSAVWRLQEVPSAELTLLISGTAVGHSRTTPNYEGGRAASGRRWDCLGAPD